ncbi:hypothetical protein L218DRAFT_944690 [Marasmius fiardii PR-910]|nr:hypothetical protein L218DRAFT_944690 [Marasmius fiardii PR-910]
MAYVSQLFQFCIFLMCVGHFSLIIDTILIFRFFAIWGYRKSFMVIPIMVLILINAGAAATGIQWFRKAMLTESQWNTKLAEILAGIFIGCNMILHSLLTLAIGEYNDLVLGILLESGALHIVYLVIFILLQGADVGSILIQVTGIAPTILIVRANLPKYRNNCHIDPRRDDCSSRQTAGSTPGYTRSIPDATILSILGENHEAQKCFTADV